METGRGPMETLRELIMRRRSCRRYTEQPLPREELDRLIHEAVWVPSGSNNQPWRFVVVTDRKLLREYSDACKRDWLRELDKHPHMQQYERSMRDPSYNVFYDAPALVIVYGNLDSRWCTYDCTMVAYNLMLLAEAGGMGSCWIGFAHNIFANGGVRKELGLPDGYELVAPIILGFPDRSVSSPVTKPFHIEYIDGGARAPSP
jgi:nitroreductase